MFSQRYIYLKDNKSQINYEIYYFLLKNLKDCKSLYKGTDA